MFSTLKKWATMASVIMALFVTFSMAAAVTPAQADSFFDIETIADDSAAKDVKAKPGRPASARTLKSKRAAGQVCCAMPRTGKLALAKPSDCRKAKGKIVAKKKCARVRPHSAAQFRRLVMKARSAAPSSGTPNSLTTGGAKLITCSGGGYFPCFCSGADSCNLFISACVEIGGDLNCSEHDSEGKPTGCACMN